MRWANVGIMARTTLDLDSSVLSELRRRGKREHKTQGQVASELLAKALSETSRPGNPPVRWISRDLGTPLVDLEDKEALMRAEWCYAHAVMTRVQLHKLVDELPDESIESAGVVLDRIRDSFWGALLASPPDDEPFTVEERSAVEAARRQPGISQQQLLAGLDQG